MRVHLLAFAMDNGEPLPAYEGLAAAFAKAKAEKEREEASGLRATTRDAEEASKQGEVHFKAAHGIIVAFFTLILSVFRPLECFRALVANAGQCIARPRHLPFHERFPPYASSPRPQIELLCSPY